MKQSPRVLVTGASKGIGRATMRRLEADGFHPVGVARTVPADLAPGEEFHTCDLGDPDATRAFGDELAQSADYYGLVNNAAMSPSTSFDDTTMQDMEDAHRINVTAPLLLAQALVPGMRRLGKGRIVNLTSRAMLGKVNRTAYAAAKSGLLGMSRTWALELAPDQITVNTVAPGPIDTELFRSTSRPEDPRTQTLKAAVPLGRVGEPQEVAHVISFLVAELGGFITGQTIYIDGGLTVSVVKP